MVRLMAILCVFPTQKCMSTGAGACSYLLTITLVVCHGHFEQGLSPFTSMGLQPSKYPVSISLMSEMGTLLQVLL